MPSFVVDPLSAMVERRGAREVRDIGIRTRLTDHPSIPPTPHGLPLWISTFNQRWVDHINRCHQGGDHNGKAA